MSQPILIRGHKLEADLTHKIILLTVLLSVGALFFKI